MFLVFAISNKWYYDITIQTIITIRTYWRVPQLWYSSPRSSSPPNCSPSPLPAWSPPAATPQSSPCSPYPVSFFTPPIDSSLSPPPSPTSAPAAWIARSYWGSPCTRSPTASPCSSSESWFWGFVRSGPWWTARSPPAASSSTERGDACSTDAARRWIWYFQSGSSLSTWASCSEIHSATGVTWTDSISR